MSVCPKPDSTKKNVVNPTPAKKTVNPPAKRNATCNVVSSNTTTAGGGTSSTTTIYVQGPPGPKGDKGDTGCALGLEYKGAWVAGEVYVKQDCDAAHPNASVVTYQSSSWICVEDHISEETNFPVDDGILVEGPPAPGASLWKKLVSGATSEYQLPKPDKDFFDSLKDGFFDFIDNATVGDWLKVAAVGAGLIWAGVAISDMMDKNGEPPSGDSTVTYNGSAGYSGAVEGSSLKAVLASLCEFCGVPYDVSLLTDSTVSFPIANNPTVANVILELSNVYQFDSFDSGGILKFVPRNTVPVKTIYLDELGYTRDNKPAAPIIFKREQGLNLPRQVNVTYTSVAQDYGRFGQSSQMLSFEDGNDMAVSTVCTLEDTFAKQLADITLVNANLQRNTQIWSTSLDHVDLEVGDIVELESVGPVRITSIDESDDGILNFVSSKAGSPTYVAYSAPTGVVTAPPISNNVVINYGISDTLFIDLPPLDGSDTEIRLFAATHGYGKAGWPGAAIYRSDDNGASYTNIANATQEATWGIVNVATPNVNYEVWDDTTLIEVTLKTGALTTQPDVAVLNGANRCMVGREMIAFGTATLIGPKTYRLSHLLRGRQGTDAFVDLHEAHELFVLIDSALVKLPYTKDERTKLFKFKTVTQGADISAVDAVDIQCLSHNLTPWRVSRPLITKAGTDYVLTWTERLKFNNALQDYVDLKKDDDYLGYAVAILDSSDNIKRKTVVYSNAYTYSAADQVTDFGSVQSTVKMSIAQMSTIVGGGYPTVINS